MKFTKLSLVTTLAMFTMGSSLIADDSATTVKGKGQIYYYTTDSAGATDLTDKESTAGAAAVTLDVTHKLSDTIQANFSAVGHTHLGDSVGENKMEGSRTGGYFNVANLTGTFGDTTLIAGRQLLSTPMLGGFDWLLAPGAFEAYTVSNSSIDKVTFIASYVNKWRANNSGDIFGKLADDNYAVGVVYSDVVDANLWYYNIDVADYTQIYGDVSKKLGDITLLGQVATTDYGTGDDSTAYGVKVAASLSGFDLGVAYNNVDDRAAGMVGVDSMFTSSWNSFASQDIGSSWKAEVAKEISSVNASVSFADYETNGQEFDLVLGYGIADNISLDAIYTNTKYTEDADADSAFELIGTYTF
jgi:hypothetical protein